MAEDLQTQEDVSRKSLDYISPDPPRIVPAGCGAGGWGRVAAGLGQGGVRLGLRQGWGWD